MKPSGRHIRTAIAVAVLSVAVPGRGQQTARLVVTPDALLMDERFQITVEGLRPGQEVTIRADGNRGVWLSSRTFRSDEPGT